MNGPKSWAARCMLHSARMWDVCGAQRPSVVVTNSSFVAERLQHLHRRKVQTMYPPVNVKAFAAPCDVADRGGFYLSVARLVSYSWAEFLARAFARMPNRRLKIVGTSPGMRKLETLRRPNVEALGSSPTHEVHRLMATANAFVFAGVEDFGIAAVEAQAAGTPVIAYGREGLTKTLLGLEDRRPTGLLFYEQTEEAVIEAVGRFEDEAVRRRILPENFITNASRFSAERFHDEF